MIGDSREPVVEESRKTIFAQIIALVRGDIEVVMFPEGSSFIPPVPSGLSSVVISGVPGAGTYFFHPDRISEATVRAEVEAGNHGRLLGHIESKHELADGRPLAVVQARVDGVPVQDSVVHEERVPEQMELIQRRHPEAEVSVVAPTEMIAERVMSRDLGLIKAFKDDHYRIGNLQAIEYHRTNTSVFKPGFLGDLYFMLKGNRYSKRSGDGILEVLFCGMKDLSYDAIVSYLASRPLICLGVWGEDNSFELAGFCFPTTIIGEGDQKAAFAGYGFLPKFWGTEEQEVLAALGIAVLFSELALLSLHGIRYSGNDLTAKFMERFGFRDVGTIPHYMMRRGKLVEGVVSTLSRDRFEEALAEMLSGGGSGEGRKRSARSSGSAGDAEQRKRAGADRPGAGG